MKVYRVEAWMGINPHTVTRYVAAESFEDAIKVVPEGDELAQIELLGALYSTAEEMASESSTTVKK